MDELAGFSEEARKLALDRFRIIRPHPEESQPFKSMALAAVIPVGKVRSFAHVQDLIAAGAKLPGGESCFRRPITKLS